MKNLCNGTQCWGFQFLLILDLWGVSFHAAVVLGLGKDFLFKSALGHCDYTTNFANLYLHLRVQISYYSKNVYQSIAKIEPQLLLIEDPIDFQNSYQYFNWNSGQKNRWFQLVCCIFSDADFSCQDFSDSLTLPQQMQC